MATALQLIYSVDRRVQPFYVPDSLFDLLSDRPVQKFDALYFSCVHWVFFKKPMGTQLVLIKPLQLMNNHAHYYLITITHISWSCCVFLFAVKKSNVRDKQFGDTRVYIKGWLSQEELRSVMPGVLNELILKNSSVWGYIELKIRG